MDPYLELIPRIPKNRSYWLVRTNGGKYYDDFIKGNFIGIAWNKITSNDIFVDFNKNQKDLKNTDDIAKRIHEEYPKNQQNKHLANQIVKFISEIKKVISY